jgi:hypothetical protein
MYVIYVPPAGGSRGRGEGGSRGGRGGGGGGGGEGVSRGRGGGGGRRGGGRGGAGEGGEKRNLTGYSKKMSYLLRHGAINEGVPITPDGYVSFPDMIKHTKYVKICTF